MRQNGIKTGKWEPTRQISMCTRAKVSNRGFTWHTITGPGSLTSTNYP